MTLASGEDDLPSRDRGDQAIDFAGWVKPHLAVLSAVALQQVGAADGPDLVQETLVRAWQKRDTFDPQLGTTRSWLMAILYDRARRHRLRRLRTPRPEVGEPTENSGLIEQSLDVRRAVAALAPRQRQIVTLHYIGGLTLNEVADVLGISLGATKSQLHDGKAALRRLLLDPETRND